MLALDASPHQWEISVAVADDRDREARALFSVLGRAHGLEGIAETEFDPPDESIAILTGASHVPQPQQLQVLAQAARKHERRIPRPWRRPRPLGGHPRAPVTDRGATHASARRPAGAAPAVRTRQGSARTHRDRGPVQSRSRGRRAPRRHSQHDVRDAAQLRRHDHEDRGLPRTQHLDDIAHEEAVLGVRVDRGPVPLAPLLAPSLVLPGHELRSTAAGSSRSRDSRPRRRLGGDIGRGGGLEPRLRATGRDAHRARLPLRVARGRRAQRSSSAARAPTTSHDRSTAGSPSTRVTCWSRTSARSTTCGGSRR